MVHSTRLSDAPARKSRRAGSRSQFATISLRRLQTTRRFRPKSFLGPLAPELLLWIGDWAVWPFSQHMPLFERLRQAFGEERPLNEAPGHLLTPDEAEDSVSIIAVALLFIWDCHILTSSGQDAAFVSHDEIGWFASRDSSVAESARARLVEIVK
jgi:hypothetical protein